VVTVTANWEGESPAACVLGRPAAAGLGREGGAHAVL